jgi:prepilin-type N-terminal cleavage/methylation domain-containing protein
MRHPIRSVLRGFTLIEMAIVLAIVGVVAVLLLRATDGILDAQKRTAVRSKLDAIDTALANFVAINKRLPCPADGRIASGVLNAGVETLSAGPPPGAATPKGTCNPVNQQFGVLPWVTLGLSELDASDPWDGRFSYRVDPALAAGAPLTLLMNMSNCDPSATGAVGAGGACATPTPPCTGNAGCTSPSNFLANKGLDVWDGQNAAAGFAARQNNRSNGSGAAYVVISHGPNGEGAYHNTGIAPRAVTVASGDNELPNANNQAIVLAAVAANAYRDAPLNDNATARFVPPGPPPPPFAGVHFDDYLSHPTIMAVLNRATLGPRAH